MDFQESVILADHCNYRIGGPARFFFEAKNADEIRWAAAEAKRRGVKIFILGSGTNLLIGDDGFDGLVLNPNINFIEIISNFRKSDFLGKSDFRKVELRIGAGTPIADLLDYTIANGLSGLEWAGGLPGTLGGAIRGNAGAFGGEIKDTIVEAESFDIEKMELRKRTAEECEFGYRDSIFKKLRGREIILSAVFELRKGDAAEIKKSIFEKEEYRRSRHPLEYPNIGSIFKNVPVELVPEDIREKCADVIKNDPFPVVPAARLIKLAGLKGKKRGGAMISEKHANFIVNTGGAKAADVKYLIDLARREVKSRFGIELEEEVQML